MSLNTTYKVTLTEGQIGIILCSLEDSVKKSEHLRKDRVKGQSLQPFDEYDENLYEVLAPYVLDEEGSYEVMQEFIIDRREQF